MIDFRHDYHRAVFLSATPRSGSTWVANVLRDKGVRLMFEPFQSDFVPEARDFPYALYLRPDDAGEARRRYARAVLEGRVHAAWIDRRPQPRIARERLVKEVRANLWLRWLGESFPGLPIIVLLRHPCAAAESLAALGWPSRLGDFASDRRLVEDHLRPLLDVLNSARGAFEEHVAVWCIQQYVALRQLAPGSALYVFYERFVAKPNDELERVAHFLKRRPRALRPSALKEAAWTTRPDSPAQAGAGPGLVDGWVKKISADQRRRADEIVAAFGLQAIYRGGVEPDVAATDALLGSVRPTRS